MLECELPKDSHWTEEHYAGSPGAVVETVRFGKQVEKAPENFAEAVIYGASKDIVPELKTVSSLSPIAAIDEVDSGGIFFSRGKALLRVFESGLYTFVLQNREATGGDIADFEISGMKRGNGTGMYPTGEFGLVSQKNYLAKKLAKLEKGVFYPVQLTRTHPNVTASLSRVDLYMMKGDHATNKDHYRKVPRGVGSWGGICTCPSGRQYPVGDTGRCKSIACEGGKAGSCGRGKIPPSAAGFKVTCDKSEYDLTKIPLSGKYIVRSYLEPQIGGPGVLCGDADGCGLPRKDSQPSLLQVAQKRVEPRPPERANRAKTSMIPMSEITGMRQRAPGLGEVPHGIEAQSMLRTALLQQHLRNPVEATTTEMSKGYAAG
jgi:hypothetical protein